ncbi:MAG TPA: hypothetical protein VK914_06335 [bacterium]|nr:hypothetical protein [bacterium]
MNRARGGFLGLAGGCLVGLFALLASGCSNHGPVGVFSPELFGKNIGAPNLQLYAATNLTITTYTYSSGCLNCYSDFTNGSTAGGPGEDWWEMEVSISNVGGSGTYCPVVATFSATDPYLQFVTNPAVQGAPAGASAVTQLGVGNEILPFSQTVEGMYQGYDNNGDLVDFTTGFSLAFVYKNNPSNPPPYYPVNITMTMTDGLKYTYVSTFPIYVVQTNAAPPS